jgi:GNAT superfamily N-acetyltransferase
MISIDLPAALAEQGFETKGIESFQPGEIIDFVHTMLLADCQMDAHRELEDSVGKFFADYNPGKRLFLAIIKGGKLCAFTAIDRYNDRTATPKWIFVSGAFRGLGLGSWLLDSALTYARSVGYEKAILCTASSMEAAHHLYRSKGFVFKQWVTFWRQRMQVFENILQQPDHVA